MAAGTRGVGAGLADLLNPLLVSPLLGTNQRILLEHLFSLVNPLLASAYPLAEPLHGSGCLPTGSVGGSGLGWEAPHPWILRRWGRLLMTFT